MARSIWQATIVDDAGNVVPNALIEIRRKFNNQLAPVFDARVGGSSKGNPFNADSNGFAFGYVAPGRYRIKASASGFEKIIEDVLIVDELATDTNLLNYGFSNLRLLCVANESDDLVFSVVARNPEFPIYVAFRSSDPESGEPDVVEITGSTVITVPADATLGLSNDETANIYPILTYDSVNGVQVGISKSIQYASQGAFVSTTAISTGSDSDSTVYTPDAATDAAFVNIGMVRIQRGTDAWPNAPDIVVTTATPVAEVVADGSEGLMTGADKTKLDGISAGADVTRDAINNASAKTTPVDADLFGILDSAASFVLKKLSWENIKATLKTYFDTLYASAASANIPEYNYLINPDFTINQRGGSSSDDNFAVDRWYVLKDASDTIVSQHINPDPTAGFYLPGANGSVRFFSVDGDDAKIGIAQILTAEDTQSLKGDACSLSFYWEHSGLGSTMRAAVIEWTGTADAVTSDIVSSWNSAGTNPTLIANAAYANTPSNLSPGLSKIENISVSSSANNLIVFIWYDGVTFDISDFVHISAVKLQKGPVCTPFFNSKRNLEQEIALCQRFYQKSYNLGTNPGTASTTAGAAYTRAPSTAASLVALQQTLATRMRATPTITWYSTVTGTAARVRNDSSGADLTVSSNVAEGQLSTGWPITSAGPSDGHQLAAHWTADAEL